MTTTFPSFAASGLVAAFAFGMSASGFAQVSTLGAVVRLSVPDQAAQAAQATAAIDFTRARPMPLPNPGLRPPSSADSSLFAPNTHSGGPGAVPGAQGTGVRTPVRLAPEAGSAIGNQDFVTPQEFGTSSHVFNTSRVDASRDTTQSRYPFRATGKLFFSLDGGTATCSASLVKPGVVVTAAHCVADFGRRRFYSNWVFAPAYSDGVGPFGAWTVAAAFVTSSYYTGSDTCAVSGVVCQNDVAVLLLKPQQGKYAGHATGYLGYGWNGWGFNSAKEALIGQLGYPAAIDSGLFMLRNDSQGYVSPGFTNNTILGSLMTGGSSGGPWLVNLGMPAASNTSGAGTYAAHNIVVGVTSWGYTDPSIKEQGASPFTSANVVPLVRQACTAAPGAC